MIEKMSRPLVIYHGNCTDGITSAWVASRANPYGEFYPASYGAPAPNCSGKDVVMIDFSYSRAELEYIKSVAKSVLVLDHHKSAQENLEGLDYCIFDMNRSGAGLAWDTFFPDSPRPWVVNYVEDKDLWRFNLPYSREINHALNSYDIGHSNSFRAKTVFSVMDLISHRQLDAEGIPQSLVTEGKTLLRQAQGQVNRIVKNSKEIFFLQHKVLSVNTPILQSETANYLAKGRPFGIAWFFDGDSYIVSLRSTEESDFDVSKIASYFGGGGHKHAAGFVLPKDSTLLL